MPQPFLLGNQPVIAFVGASEPGRAKAFYGGVLGLRLVSEELPFALVYDAAGIMLRVTILKSVNAATHTVLGWRVTDIAVAAKALEESGVRFERYPGMAQDELGVWSSPSGAKVAWFKDPDGNTLSISEHP